MALTDINITRKNSGFTIVELLIVIVVIAILATISIVAYSGIQSRAKATKAQANASLAQKVAEAYYADKNVYPTTTAMFTTGNTYATLPSSVTVLTAGTVGTLPTLNASNGESSLMYRYVTGAAGACIYYWDFSSGAAGAISSGIYMGTGTSANCSATTAANGNTPTS